MVGRLARALAIALICFAPASASAHLPFSGPEPPPPPDISVESRTLTSTNFDGTQWRLEYLTNRSDPWAPETHGFAATVVEHAARVYGEQVGGSTAACAGAVNPGPNWGFESADPDCTLTLRFVCGGPPSVDPGCQFGRSTGQGGDVDLWINAGSEYFATAYGYYTNKEKHDSVTLARAILAHEHFHYLQDVAMAGAAPDGIALTEGSATLASTLLDPATEADRSSVFARSVKEQLQPNLSRGLCTWGYGAAAFWGYLYSVDGGVETIQRILEGAAGPGACPSALAAAVDAALGSRPGAHDSLAASLSDFAVSLYTRDLEWGRPDGTAAERFGDYIDPVLEHPLVPALPNPVEAWGLDYLTLPPAGSYDVAWSAADDDWALRLLVRDSDGGVSVVPLPPGEPVAVDAGEHQHAVVAAVRTAPRSGDYSVTLTPRATLPRY